MAVIEFIQSLLGEEFGKVKSVCKGGSWLYTQTPEGEIKQKICVPRLETSEEGKPIGELLSWDLADEDVLFIETDRGVIVKDGSLYRFYKKDSYRWNWKK